MSYWILLFLFPNSSLDAKSLVELIFDTDITGDIGGFTDRSPDQKERDRYLLMSPVQKARVTETLVPLVNQPQRL